MVKKIVRNTNAFEVVDDELGKTFGVYDTEDEAILSLY